MNRFVPNILCADVDGTARFYERLMGMHRHYDSDWFVILSHTGMEGLEFGLLQRDHDIVPAEVRSRPAGMMITFVVADCDAVHAIASELGTSVIEPPTDMPYGQRRMLLRDPEGTVLDVSSLIARR
ncbi:VOC family protein [Tabrizicola sp.]|uniref:VOC family protein n=1 Tax=Tabrizicola sp. TaxID=2005166 RepID=UPI003F338FF3